MKTTTFIYRAAILLLTAVLTVATAWAQTGEAKMCVVIHETERTTAFDLESRPVVSFTETDVKLECNDITVLYSLDNYLKLTIEESGIANGMKKLADETFRINGSSITATGCNNLSIYAVDGRCLVTGRASADGVVNLNIGQLRAGTYIAVFGNKSFKIYKQ